jgi:fumarylacetoacetase
MHTIDFALRAFVPGAQDSEFPLQNLPYGIFNTARAPRPRVGVAIGDQILDLAAAAQAGLLVSVSADALLQPTLNALAALGRARWTALRAEAALLQEGSPLATYPQATQLLVPQAEARMHLPFAIGGFTDFYASKTTPTTAAACSATRPTPCRPTGSTSPSAITAAPAASCWAVRRWCAPASCPARKGPAGAHAVAGLRTGDWRLHRP